jgi:hypothetical protein
MNEATLTTTISGQALRAGAIVLTELGLAMIAELPGNDTARIITESTGSDDLTTRAATCSSLRPAPNELDAAQRHLAQRLMIQFAADAQDHAGRLREQASAAQQKIASMRAYAVDKHRDGTICREGLNDFLAAHDLDLYQPRHRAQVTITLDVEVDGADDPYEATQMVRGCIEVTSNDNGDVWITSGPDLTVSGVQPLPDD